MAVVALIPTGKMEHLALGTSLQRIFPEHDFVVRPTEDVLDGFTSNDVSHFTNGIQSNEETTLDELVGQLVNAIFPGRKSDRFDFAYVLEDLELCNQHQPDAVIDVFGNAVEKYIDRYWPQSVTHRTEIRSRCSFHLFRPMTEAYFFGDSAALERAKITRTPVLPDEVELEVFQTNDPDYLSLPSKAEFPSWLFFKDPPHRARHPKSYLQFLCDPTMRNKKLKYQETGQGAAALRSLDWEAVVSHPSHCPFLTAFLDDLSQALCCNLPFIQPKNADPRLRVDSSKRVLRNL